LTDIYVDGDACPVREEIYRVAARLKVKVFVVSNGSRPIRPPGMSNLSMVSSTPLQMLSKNNVRGGAAVRPAYLEAADADRRIGSRDQERARKAARTDNTRGAEARTTAPSRTADLRRAGRSSAA
jgi:hypothetical protein